MQLKYVLQALTILWYGIIIAIIYAGWMTRDQRYLIAESGIGYWLGILGGCMMLLLLIYPLRKRVPRWRYAGSIKFWFRLHMFLGIAGPVMIILHTGFRLGSLNGRVALLCMLIVAGSGLIGRYLYRRIHHGLYGEKIRFDELYHQEREWEQSVRLLTQQQPGLAHDLQQLQQQLVNRHTGINRSLLFYLGMRWKLRTLRKKISHTLKAPQDCTILLNGISSLRSICRLGINEILFSYWHILHYPLFIMLLISGITHVAVVNFY